MDNKLETLRLALLLVGKHADEAMHVRRVSRDVLEEIEQHEATLKAMIAEISAPEAADEITRLNALVDEMREGLDDVELPDRLVKIGHHLTGCHEKDKARDVWEAGRLLRALITKASRDSGHG